MSRSLSQRTEGPPESVRPSAGRDDHALYEDLSRLNNELTTLQRELARKNVELERLNEQKNQFLGIAAHDLRNPLEVIMTHSEFLIEDAVGKLGEEQLGFIRTIRLSSSYMLSLVNDFLDHTRIEAGRLSLEPEMNDLAECVDGVVAMLRPIAKKKNVAIAFELESCAAVRIRIDASRIEQVLHNLIWNAVKFSRAGGEVRVAVACDDASATISVEDDGVGIGAGELDDIFRPFHRGTSQSTSSEKSVGLGLAIARRIAEAHGGAISVTSEPGRGARFCLELPTVSARKEVKQ